MTPDWIDGLLFGALAIAITVAVAIPRLRGYAVGAAGLLAGALGLRPRKGKEAPKAPQPPPPKHTAEEHETAIVLETAEVVDQAAAAHDADPNDVAELVELADKTRSK